MVDSVRSPGMTSDAAATLTTRADYARLACGASRSPVLTDCAAWSYKMVMSVSDFFFKTRQFISYLKKTLERVSV